MVGYGDDFTQTTIIELKYNYNVTEYTKGNGYAMVSLVFQLLINSAEIIKLKAANILLTRLNFYFPGIMFE